MKKIIDYLIAGISGALFASVCFYMLFNFTSVVQAKEKRFVGSETESVEGRTSVNSDSGRGVGSGGSKGCCADFVTAAEKSINAVVHIKSQMVRKSGSYDLFFGNQMYIRPRTKMYTSTGSGVIITADGYIVTNYHVVDGADMITVTLNDNGEYDARIVGIDPATDLAVIKIEDNDLPYLEFGDSNEVRIGEWVLAVGNPFNLTSTVTAGIVSAKARNINILPNGGIESFIQTDAAVNRGNSGGALVNTAGDLIGVNAAIASETGYYNGYSFAIPSNIVRKVSNDIIKYGEVHRAFIGINVVELNETNSKQMGLGVKKGLFVRDITTVGSAHSSGVKSGDVILSIEGIKTGTFSELQEIVGQYNPGDVVKIEIIRDNKKELLSVKLIDKYGRTTPK